MLDLRLILVICTLCLAALYGLLQAINRLLRYWSVRKPQTGRDVLKLLTCSRYELEVELEAKFQPDREPAHAARASEFSLDDYLQQYASQQTETDRLAQALGDSPFFKTLDEPALRAVARALQPEDQSSGGIRRDCIYQSDSGLQQLFVLPSCESVASLRMDYQSQFDIPPGERILFSPSSLACSLLSLPCPVSFPCALHGRFAPATYWSITFAGLSECLTGWPDARRRLLQQFWSHVNDVLLLVFVEWLNLDALKFLDAAGYEKLLARVTEDLSEDLLAASGGLEFSAMSFYERRSLYKRLALRILREIGECGAGNSGGVFEGSAVESDVAVGFHPAGQLVTCRSAFLVLEGRLEAVTHPTLNRQLAQPHVGHRKLPGWVGLIQYFSHSQLPFELSSVAGSDGVVLAELPDKLMDRLFGSLSAPTFEAATRFLLLQLNPQLYRHDILINHRRLHRGDHLVRRGDPAETIEIVVSGRLRHQTAEFSRGDCVGLVESLLGSGESCAWAQDVVAVRESRSVSIPIGLARSWVSQNHRLLILDRVLGNLCQLELDRQQRAHSANVRDYLTDEAEEDESGFEKSRSVTPKKSRNTRPQPRQGRSRDTLVGYLIDSARFNQPLLLRLLGSCLHAVHGSAARLVSETDVQEHFGRPADQLPDAALRAWLEEQELTYPTLALVCSSSVTRWTRLVLGYLDCLVVWCDADAPRGAGEDPSDTELFYSQMFRCRVHLAVMHPLTLSPVPAGTSLRFQRRRHWWTSRIHHVRCCTHYYKATAAKVEDSSMPTPAFNSDLARLVRFTTGRAVGVAFGSGGGSQGLGNLGALQALLEQDVAVDAVAGSGRGALVAAAWALHHRDLRATRAAVERLLSRVNSPLGRLRDLTLPLVSMFTGAGLNSALRDLFGEHRQIEDLWLPCVTVSTDLIEGRPVVHASGTLWRAVRGSCGQIGAYPPVWEPRTGRLLVDGAHTDRLPSGTLMCSLRAHRVLAIALDDRRRLRHGNYLVFGDHVSGWGELLRWLNPLRLTPLAPSAADIQTALTNLAAVKTFDSEEADGAEEEEEKEEDGNNDEDDDWCRCLVVRPDPSFSAGEEDCRRDGPGAAAAERCSGYWAVRRRLRRMSNKMRAGLHAWRRD